MGFYMGNEKFRYETIVNYINELKIEKPTILDLGCGYGALLDYLSPQNYNYYLGIDLSSNAINKATNNKYHNADFLVADIHLFKPNTTFNFIILNEVLYYLDNQMEIVEKYAKYFNRENGYYIFSFYGIREDLIIELEKKYILIKKEVISQSESVFWGICLYKV
jgi:SAM-dependent methyltransferase